jgi:hypothetical protein
MPRSLNNFYFFYSGGSFYKRVLLPRVIDRYKPVILYFTIVVFSRRALDLRQSSILPSTITSLSVSIHTFAPQESGLSGL